MSFFTRPCRLFITLTLSSLIVSCDGSSSPTETTSQNDASDLKNASTAIFQMDTTVRDLGGTPPLNTTRVPADEELFQLPSLLFVDDKGVEIVFRGSSEEVLDELDIKTGITISGFTAENLATDGFLSIVYPDGYNGERSVRLLSPVSANFVVYWPDGKTYEVMPATTTADNALEISLPSGYKQTFFALLIEGALEE